MIRFCEFCFLALIFLMRSYDFNQLSMLLIGVDYYFLITKYRIQIQRISEHGSLPNKSRKKNEEKININIFLGHNVPELELGSDSESGVRPTTSKTVCIHGFAIFGLALFPFSLIITFDIYKLEELWRSK